MLCDSCGDRESVVKLVQIVEGSPRELHLCEKCAAEKGVEIKGAVPPPQLTELLLKLQQQPLLAGSGGGGAGGSAAPRDAARCTFCAATIDDFKATGRLGCAQCYGAFESSLRDLLKRVHGSSRHTGRRYEAPRPDSFQQAVTLGELRDRLKRAIESEQFELAADIRDRIRVLE
jgi:protein arginine kinase activator